MSPPDPPAGPLETTAVLLERWKDGDEQAREALFQRTLPVFQRWAHGRIPAHTRHLADTGDLVQVTLVRALNHLHEFDCRREGALLAYLRRGLLNAVRDQVRRAAVRTPSGIEPEALASADRSPLEHVMGRDVVESYEAALARLPEEQQEAVMMRLELGMDWPAIAAALGRPSPNAARMLVARAIARLAQDMHAHRS